VVVAFKDNAEASFSQFLYDFVSIAEVLVDARDIFVTVGVKSIIGLLVKYPHLGLAPWRIGVLSVQFLFLSFLNGEEIDGFVLEHLSLLHVPHVRAEQFESVVGRHRKSLVVIRSSCAILLVSQGGEL